MKFILKDPQGQIKWSKLVNNNLDETKEFNKIIGKWKLSFESIDDNTEGSLNIKFSEK